MNILNNIFLKYNIEEIASNKFLVMSSNDIDFKFFLRDKMDYIYIDDLEIVLNTKDVLLMMNQIDNLMDFQKNSLVSDYEHLNFNTDFKYIVISKEGQKFGIIDVTRYRTCLKLLGNEISDLLKEILNTSHDAICIVNDEKRVLLWNHKAEEIYGINEDEIIGRNITKLFPKALLPHVIDFKKSYNDVFNNPRGDFKNIIKARPLFNNNKLIGGISCDKDITNISEENSKIELDNSKINIVNIYKNTFNDLIGEDSHFREIVQFAKKISDSNINVLITGESGTGKELFSQSIHNESGRSGQFIPVNCSAIPKDLIESELFGYEKGSFTGALSEGKIGKFELANNGTILLDEIGDLPYAMQPKILRILEDGIFYRVGGNNAIKVDVRVIASTNKNLKNMMKNNVFRKDLFYRLNSVHISLPPLRKRKRDIPLLINKFIKEFSLVYKVNIFEMPIDIVEKMMNYPLEGNIRELRNIIERYVIMKKNGISDLSAPILMQFNPTDFCVKKGINLNEKLIQLEKDLIVKALEEAKYNKAKAARLLEIPRTTLIYKLEKLKINVE